MQESLFYDSIQDALRDVIRACGGPKVVGCKLWPSLSPDRAANAVNDCLNPDRRQHFGEDEVIHLLRLGRDSECHVGMAFIAQACGYSDPVPVQPQDEIAALQSRFIEAAQSLKAMSARIEAITARAALVEVRRRG